MAIYYFARFGAVVALGLLLYVGTAGTACGTTLYGHVEREGPDIDAFISQSADIVCVRYESALRRVQRAAYDEAARCRVWRRVKKEELRFVSAKKLRAIEDVAATCGMPLI